MPWLFTWRPVGAGKTRFLAWPLLFGLEARDTDGAFSKFTRGVSDESFLKFAYYIESE
jgi:hypothetical protein